MMQRSSSLQAGSDRHTDAEPWRLATWSRHGTLTRDILTMVAANIPNASSPAAERMRRHRGRRRDGLRCFMVELRETEIAALVRERLLKPEHIRNDQAILTGLYAFLDRALDRES